VGGSPANVEEFKHPEARGGRFDVLVEGLGFGGRTGDSAVGKDVLLEECLPLLID